MSSKKKQKICYDVHTGNLIEYVRFSWFIKIYEIRLVMCRYIENNGLVLLPLWHCCSNLRLNRMFSGERHAERPDGVAPIDDFLKFGIDRQERRAVLFTRSSLSYFTRIDP